MPPQSAAPAQPEGQSSVPPVPPAQNPYQPQSPEPTLPPSEPQHKKSYAVLIIVAFVIVIAALVGLAFAGIIPNPISGGAPYSEDHLLGDIAKGMSKVSSGTYTFELSLKSKPKDADAEPFTVEVKEDPALVAALQRDYDKVRDVQQISDQIRMYQYKNKKYPTDLSTLDVPQTNTVVYTQTEAGKNYTLTVTFETAKAVEAAQNYGNKPTINGKTVTFDNKSSTYMYLDTRTEQPEIIEFLNMQNELSYIPSPFEIVAKITGATDNASSKLNTELNFTADANFGDMLIALEAEFKKVGDDFYVQAKKFPSFFGDFSSIKGKWIKITPQDFSQYGLGMNYSNTNSASKEYEEAKEKIIEQLKLMLEIADRDQAVLLKGKPVREKVNGMNTYRYDLMFSRENIAKFYKDVPAEFSKKYGDDTPIKLDQATLDFLESKAADDVFNYINKNMTLSVWATSDGLPVKYLVGFRIVPGGKTPSNNQINLDLTYSINNVNKKITVSAPKESMSVEDAYMILTGKSKEEITFEKQTQAISQIRFALSDYKRVSGAYPLALQELTTKRSDATTTSNTDTYYVGDAPFMQAVPNDAYTNNAFTYTSDGKTYSLSYSMTISPNIKTGYYNVYERDYTNPKSQRIYLRYVNGLNTADDKVISKEAVAASKIDTDKDDVADTLEQFFGTDIKKKDTDGDGYSDYKEITSGTNPNGPGSLDQGRITNELPIVY